MLLQGKKKVISSTTIAGGNLALKRREIYKEDIGSSLCKLLHFLMGTEELTNPSPPSTDPRSLDQTINLASGSQVSGLHDLVDKTMDYSGPSSQDPSSQVKLKHDDDCSDHSRGQCKHGFKGTNCEFYHKKICSKFLRNGKFRGGCLKGKECKNLHVQFCKSSFTKRKCFNPDCKLRHLPRTQREESFKMLQKLPEHKPEARRSVSVFPWIVQPQQNREFAMSSASDDAERSHQTNTKDSFLLLAKMMGEMRISLERLESHVYRTQK